jgi:hypothetical protein
MTRHISRKQRWAKRGPAEYVWNGVTVRPLRGAWHAWLAYEVQSEAELALWEARTEQLGPFKRPRNAMIAAEEQVRFLERRHGERIRFPGG